MEITYGIACYHRPECKTLHTLLKAEIPKDRILIAVNCAEDYETYSKKYGRDFEILYKPKKNVAGNRNNMLERMSGKIVLLDDDIVAFKRYERSNGKYGKFVDACAEEFEKMLADCFAKAEETKSVLFGFASSGNPMNAAQYFDNHHRYSVNGNFQGGFCGYPDTALRHDESYDVLDDYELNLRILAEGKNILRRNDWMADKGKMAGNSGGCKELYDSGAQHRCMRRLEKQWGFLFTTAKQDKGIRVTCAKVEGLK